MNSNVLITGASAGIGRALAYKFSSNVKSLVLCSRNEEELVKVKERVEKKELKVYVFPCDLSSEKNCIRLSDFAISKNVNVLINNAAIHCPAISLNNISVWFLDFLALIDTFLFEFKDANIIAVLH